MKTAIKAIFCAAAVVLGAASCQKSNPADEGGKGTIDVRISGLMGEYTQVDDTKAELVNNVRVSWKGGETAEMPGMYEGGEYDIAGYTTGVVEKSRLIDGSKVKAGDVLVGIPLTGVHSNGFSLVRKIIADAGLSFFDEIPEFGGRRLGDVLLTPGL